MKKYITYITGLALVAMMAACSSDDDLAATTNGNRISFQTSIATRARRIDNISKLTSVNLSGWQYATESDFASTAPNSFFYGEEVAIASDGTVTTNYNWPNNGSRLSFFAYGPVDATDNGLVPTTAAANKGPAKFQYTVPSDTSKQRDLIFGTVHNISADQSGAVAMTLNHALTAVQIVIGPDSKAVTWDKIELQNIRNYGTYEMNTGWTGEQGAVTYTLTPGVTEGTQNYQFVGNDSSLLLLPQTLSDQAQIAVTYTDNGQSFTKYLTPKTKTWAPGTVVTYQLSVTSRYDLLLKSTVTDWVAGDTKEISAETPTQE